MLNWEINGEACRKLKKEIHSKPASLHSQEDIIETKSKAFIVDERQRRAYERYQKVALIEEHLVSFNNMSDFDTYNFKQHQERYLTKLK